MRAPLRAWLWTPGLLALSFGAAAHELSDRYGPFFGPALHVFTEADHVAACLAIGLLAGQQEMRPRAAGLVSFAAALVVMVITASLAFDRLQVFGTAEASLSPATLLVAGVLIALARKLSIWLIASVSAAMGMVHGLANGLSIGASALPAVSLLGAAGAAILTALIGALLASGFSATWARIAVRAVGSWIAALGLILFGLAVRG